VLKVGNDEFLDNLVGEFKIYGKTIDSIKDVLQDIVKTSENLIINKNEKELEALNKALELYQIPTKEFMIFIKNFVKDEYLPKFKELELQGWYKLYDEIGSSNISDEDKINRKKELMTMVSERNTEKETAGIIKFGIGVIGAIKAISSIGKTLNDLKDDQKTRRVKHKYKNKK
jgi:hypothetical protein